MFWDCKFELLVSVAIDSSAAASRNSFPSRSSRQWLTLEEERSDIVHSSLFRGDRDCLFVSTMDVGTLPLQSGQEGSLDDMQSQAEMVRKE